MRLHYSDAGNLHISTGMEKSARAILPRSMGGHSTFLMAERFSSQKPLGEEAGLSAQAHALQEQSGREEPACSASNGLSRKDVLGDGDVRAQINILDRIEQLYAFVHGALERFATGDEAGAAGALVD